MEEEKVNLLHDHQTQDYVLSSRLQKTSGRIFALIVVFTCCSIASGPLSAFATLQTLLEQSGVFSGPDQGSMFSMLYIISQSAATVCYFFTGLLYDRVGPRKAASYGGALVGVGFVMTCLAIRIRSLNWLLFLALPWTYQWGQFNSFAVFGFIWLFPNHKAMIIGITNSASALTNLFVYLFIVFQQIGISIATGFLIFGITAAISAIIVWPFAPSRTDNLYAAIQAGANPDMERVPLSKVLRDVWQEMKKNKTANALFITWSNMQYMLAIYYMAVYDNYVQAYLGTKIMKEISFGFALINAIVGLFGSPLLGALIDKIGFHSFFTLSNLLLVVWYVTSLVPNLYVQYFSLCCIVIYFTGVMLLVPRWSMYYCRPDLFGSFYGIIFTSAGLLSLILSPVLTIIAKMLPGLWSFWIPVTGLFAIGCVMSVVVNLYLWRNPIPMKKPIELSNIQDEK